MKSDRRHQLETNLLADKVGHAIDTAKPYLSWVALCICILALFSVGYLWIQGRSLEEAAVAWTQYYFADGDAKNLRPVYEDYAKTSAALWARQAEADHLFSNGIDSLYIDRKRADDFLKQAQEGYETILEDARDPFLRERATFGLAQVFESQGKREDAIRQYSEIIRMGSTQPTLVSEVETRLAALKSEPGQKFAAWFKDFRPMPSAPLGLNDLHNLPGSPNINFPPYNPVGSDLSIPGGINLNGLLNPPTSRTDSQEVITPEVKGILTEPSGLAVPPSTPGIAIPTDASSATEPTVGGLQIPIGDPPKPQP